MLQTVANSSKLGDIKTSSSGLSNVFDSIKGQPEDSVLSSLMLVGMRRSLCARGSANVLSCVSKYTKASIEGASLSGKGRFVLRRSASASDHHDPLYRVTVGNPTHSGATSPVYSPLDLAGSGLHL